MGNSPIWWGRIYQPIAVRFAFVAVLLFSFCGQRLLRNVLYKCSELRFGDLVRQAVVNPLDQMRWRLVPVVCRPIRLRRASGLPGEKPGRATRIIAIKISHKSVLEAPPMRFRYGASRPAALQSGRVPGAVKAHLAAMLLNSERHHAFNDWRQHPVQ